MDPTIQHESSDTVGEKPSDLSSTGISSNSSPDAWLVLESQLRECFGRVAYSHKTHEKSADIALKRLSLIKLWQIGLSAVTTGGLLAVVFGPNERSSVAAAFATVISTALLTLNAYTKENDLGQLGQKHKEAADKLWSIRESYLSLLTDVRAQFISIDQVRERRDALQSALNAVYESAPRTSEKGYKRAQKALKLTEDLTFSDEEIDHFLPEPLRRTNVRGAATNIPSFHRSSENLSPNA